MKLLAFETLCRSIIKNSHGLLTTKQLANLLVGESEPVRKATIQRAIKAGKLERLTRGVYAVPEQFHLETHKLEAIAKALRPGHYSYLSLESVLSEHSVMSQIPLNRITVMTTGRKQTYKTPYGIVEFTHTSRSVESIIDNTRKTPERPLRQALLKTALEDQMRVKRNLELIDLSIAKELLHESQ